MVKNLPAMQDTPAWFPVSGRFPQRREWLPTPVYLPGEFHGQRSLVATVYGVVKSQIREGNGTPLQYSCLEKSHWRRSLVGCSPWGRWESDTIERLCFHFSFSCIGEGGGNPLQCSRLENPRDGEAWWLLSMGSHRVGCDWSDLAVAVRGVGPTYITR